MVFNTLSQEEMARLVAFLNSEDDSVASTDIPKKLFGLNIAVQSKITELLDKTKKENTRLLAKVKRLDDKKTFLIENNEFSSLNLDSVEVAKALLYCLQHLTTYRLTMTKLLAILYLMYASWLASKNERLFAEHPVVSQYGPQFWRVFKRLNVKEQVSDNDWMALTSKCPAVAAFCRNAANKYYDYRESDLTDVIIKSAPFKNALPETNNGKWGKVIPDNEIFAWKTELNNRK